MVSTLKLTKIQIPNSDSDVISLDASTGNITLNKTLSGTFQVRNRQLHNLFKTKWELSETLQKDYDNDYQNYKDTIWKSISEHEGSVSHLSFLTDMENDFKKYNEIYAEYFKHDQPCRTRVEISSFPTPIAIELKCIATID